MRRFELLEPRSVGEACRFLSEYGEGAKLLAGGTALVKLIKKRLIDPSYLVDLKGIRELAYIRWEEEGLRIGALTTLSEIEGSSVVRGQMGVLGEMVHGIGSVQIRNVGTLVGNLCFGDPASDAAPLLMVLGASLKVASLGGVREIPLEGFFKDFYETGLGEGEVVEEIGIPVLPERTGVVYLRHSVRAGFDPAVVGVGVVITIGGQDGRCEEARVVLGGVRATPFRVEGVEESLRGRVVGESLIRKVVEGALEGLEVMQDVRASADYRRQMVRLYVERGIGVAMERAKGGRA